MIDMDTINEIQLDPATFKYPAGLQQVFRDIEDPFEKEFEKLKFEALVGRADASANN
jgi:hypothetical protein